MASRASSWRCGDMKFQARRPIICSGEHFKSVQTAWLKRRHHALQVGLFVGDGRAVEKVAVAALADAQFAFPLAQQIGGILQLIAERGDFIRPLRQRFQRQAVGQAARILLHRLQAPHHAAGQQQVNEQGAQRAEDAADNHRAEQPDARLVALIAVPV